MNGQNRQIKQATQHTTSNPMGMVATQKMVVAFILMIALLSFEAFNFDTTRFALRSLLGEVNFLGISWAAILAIAFCAIDFAGLTRIFTPEKGQEEPKAVWYLMGAWLLGATMNAMMTWWAVSLTLLDHAFGNEVLSRAQLLQWVPLFVAAFVWLTRILFIGAISVAGEYIFDFSGVSLGKGNGLLGKRPSPHPQSRPATPAQPMHARPVQTTHNRPPQPNNAPVHKTGVYARPRR